MKLVAGHAGVSVAGEELEQIRTGEQWLITQTPSCMGSCLYQGLHLHSDRLDLISSLLRELKVHRLLHASSLEAALRPVLDLGFA